MLMQRLGDMIRQLGRYRRQWERVMEASSIARSAFEDPALSQSRLTETVEFGANPGNLRMFTYAPPDLPPSPALVVVLHGCTQTAAGYDLGTGWSVVAERYGFVVLLPEQKEANNPKRCFNWFQFGDIQRDHGEARSIRQMIEHAVREHHVDRSRIFVTGLSAGGAMTATMLATYPEVFAGGAIVAGLPYRCATSVPEAFECMFQGRMHPAEEWGDLVRNASSHRGPWPKVSVWHGTADATVLPMNAGEIIKQWTNVHGLPMTPSREEVVDGYPRRVWANEAGEDTIEEYTVTGMAHGTPLATNGGDNSYGVAGPFLLEVGISSSYHIAKFWGLTRSESETVKPRPATPRPGQETTTASARPSIASPSKETLVARDRPKEQRQEKPSHIDVGAVITKALRAAGLMK